MSILPNEIRDYLPSQEQEMGLESILAQLVKSRHIIVGNISIVNKPGEGESHTWEIKFMFESSKRESFLPTVDPPPQGGPRKISGISGLVCAPERLDGPRAYRQVMRDILALTQDGTELDPEQLLLEIAQIARNVLREGDVR